MWAQCLYIDITREECYQCVGGIGKYSKNRLWNFEIIFSFHNCRLRYKLVCENDYCLRVFWLGIFNGERHRVIKAVSTLQIIKVILVLQLGNQPLPKTNSNPVLFYDKNVVLCVLKLCKKFDVKVLAYSRIRSHRCSGIRRAFADWKLKKLIEAPLFYRKIVHSKGLRKLKHFSTSKFAAFEVIQTHKKHWTQHLQKYNVWCGVQGPALSTLNWRL